MSNLYNMTDTWTDVTVTYNGIKLNVTDTASNAASMLMVLQVGGVTKYSISKNGDVVFRHNITTGLRATSAAAPTFASAATIAPSTSIAFVSGTAAIATITPPSPISLGGGQVTLIPTGIFTWTAAGNIALAGTAVVGKALTLTYDVTTAKWYPSYT